MFFDIFTVCLLILCYCSFMNFLVTLWIFRVDINFLVLKLDTFRGAFIEYDVEGYELLLLACEKCMLLHLSPVWSELRVVLHGVIQKIKALKWNLNVWWPCPITLLYLLVQHWESNLVGWLGFNIEDKHACEHLVKDYSNGPYVYFMAISSTLVHPKGAELLSGHH